jgi:hypothetical protein
LPSEWLPRARSAAMQLTQMYTPAYQWLVYPPWYQERMVPRQPARRPAGGRSAQLHPRRRPAPGQRTCGSQHRPPRRRRTQ